MFNINAYIRQKLKAKPLSIKALTLYGFGCVLLPLTLTLVYSASQVNQLSQHGSKAIITVAELADNSRELTYLFNNSQRLAGQYAVLAEPALFARYRQEQQALLNLAKQSLSEQHVPIFQQLAENFHHIEQLLSEKENDLNDVQQAFKQVAQLIQKINQVNNQLIAEQANRMKHSADAVKQTILKSLVIIPLTLIVALVFILLITQPLKQLLKKVHRLEQGFFEEKIHFSGAQEMKEIAVALELMRTRLHALELQKSSFIRHISHELKTPLAAMREGTELLYDNSLGKLNNDQQEVTEILKQSVARLQQLIEDLLDFNIVLDSTSLQDVQQLSVAEVIKQAISQRKLDWQSKHLNLELALAEVTIKSNEKQLLVIIDNLLSNAIKYSPDHGHVYINCFVTTKQVVVEIIDQGPGIEETIQDKVFEAFYQGPKPENYTIKSSGLGLTIVAELLMRLNGEIQLSNVTDAEHGLLVRLILPYQGEE